MRVWITAASLMVVAWNVSPAQQTPGAIRPRPGEGRQPEFPPPTILQYKPRSTLVVPAHPVPRAKFPVVDFHGHPPFLVTPDVIEKVGQAMDDLNLRVMVNASGTSGERLTQQIAAVKASTVRSPTAILR